MASSLLLYLFVYVILFMLPFIYLLYCFYVFYCLSCQYNNHVLGPLIRRHQTYSLLSLLVVCFFIISSSLLFSFLWDMSHGGTVVSCNYLMLNKVYYFFSPLFFSMGHVTWRDRSILQLSHVEQGLLF
jgi:hypothetical protein